MILIKPLTVTSSILTSSIAEPDSAVGEVEWISGTYNLGDRVIKSSTHRVYEVVADPSTNDDPAVGVTKTPKTWVDVGSTNKFKMFDEANNTASVGDNLTVDIVPVSLVNSLAFFNVNCSIINITVFDNVGNTVYTRSEEMRSRPLVNGWYNYFYSGFTAKTKLVDLDMPPTTIGKITVEFVGSGASVGTFVCGKQAELGDTQYGTGAQLLDFSTPIEDEYGNISYTAGFTAKLVDYDIMTDTTKLDSIFTEIESLGKRNAVFVGNPASIGDSTLTYGFVRDYNQVYTWPTKSKIALTVRGLI